VRIEFEILAHYYEQCGTGSFIQQIVMSSLICFRPLHNSNYDSTIIIMTVNSHPSLCRKLKYSRSDNNIIIICPHVGYMFAFVLNT
jgi:hypothetical protein